MTERPLAVVTGASSGIGLELAKQFAEHGYDVAISGSSERVFESAQQLEAEYSVTAYPYQGDAATYEGVEAFGSPCCSWTGRFWSRRSTSASVSAARSSTTTSTTTFAWSR